MLAARGALPIVLALALANAGCLKLQGPITPKPKPKPSAEVVPGKPTVLDATTRVVAQVGTPATLIGKIRLISEAGGAIISDGGGAIISNNTGSLVANNAGNIVSDAGGAWRLLATAPKGEAALAEAQVRLFDATGALLVDEHGKPLTATSDGHGSYQLQAVLPKDNLVLRVALGKGSALAGGELTAMVVPGAGQQEVPIDTASSLGAAYVLGQYVQGSQQVYDKLPASEAVRLHGDLDAARALLTSVPHYEPAALSALTETLRGENKAVDKTLGEIKALLLGQANLGDGRKADTVALYNVKGLTPTADGGLLLAEPIFGRVRAIAADGTISTVCDVVRGRVKHNFPDTNDLLMEPDGSLVISTRSQVLRVTPDGEQHVLAGTVEIAHGALGGPGDQMATTPLRITRLSDGTILEAESTAQASGPPRLLAIGTDGNVKLAPYDPGKPFTHLEEVKAAPDGTVYVTYTGMVPGEDSTIVRYVPGQPPHVVGNFTRITFIALAADGSIYVAQSSARRVERVGKDDKRTVVAGVGGPAATTDLVAPSDIAVRGDGGLVVADHATQLVHELGPDGSWKVVAGVSAAAGIADLRGLALNAPNVARFDAHGDLIEAERGDFHLSRFDGKTLGTFAGTVQGFGGDGGPASAAKFDRIGGVAFKGETMVVSDPYNASLRQIAADGTISTLVGNHLNGHDVMLGKDQRVPALQYAYHGEAVTVGPDGLLYWVDHHLQIVRLAADGMVEPVVGKAIVTENPNAVSLGAFAAQPPDGAAALDYPIVFGLDLVFDRHGDLYFTDVGALQVKKVSGLAAGHPTVSSMAGRPAAAIFTAVAAGVTLTDDGTPLGTTLSMPCGLCFDDKDNMYIGEIGTVSLPLLTTLVGTQLQLAGLLPQTYARVRRLTPDGRFETIMGPGGKFFADPTAEDALQLPATISLAPDGRLAVADPAANLIRILPAGSY